MEPPAQAAGCGNAVGAAVVIAACNYGRYLAEAVESVVAQGDAVVEIVVVDDGSTDDTAEIASQLTAPRIRLIRQPNRGLSAARNTGWRAARAEWVQFLDADDKLAPGAIAALLHAARETPGRIPFGVQELYAGDFSGTPFGTSRLADHSGSLREELSVYYVGSLQTALLPRRALEELGGYDEALRLGEDYDLGIRLSRRYAFTYVPQATYCTRFHPRSLHVAARSAALEVYLGTSARHLRGEPGWSGWWRYRRAMAHWLWYFAAKSFEAGDVAEARRRYRRACYYVPVKLGAWRGWWRCLRQRPAPGAPNGT